MREPEITARIADDLRLVDDALQSNGVTAADSRERELQELALAVRAESPEPSPEFAARMDARARGLSALAPAAAGAHLPPLAHQAATSLQGRARRRGLTRPGARRDRRAAQGPRRRWRRRDRPAGPDRTGRRGGRRSRPTRRSRDADGGPLGWSARDNRARAAGRPTRFRARREPPAHRAVGLPYARGARGRARRGGGRHRASHRPLRGALCCAPRSRPATKARPAGSSTCGSRRVGCRPLSATSRSSPTCVPHAVGRRRDARVRHCGRPPAGGAGGAP